MIPLDTVNWQLSSGRRGADDGGIVDHIKDDGGQTKAGGSGPPFLSDKKDAKRTAEQAHKTISHIVMLNYLMKEKMKLFSDVERE